MIDQKHEGNVGWRVLDPFEILSVGENGPVTLVIRGLNPDGAVEILSGSAKLLELDLSHLEPQEGDTITVSFDVPELKSLIQFELS